MNDTTYTAEEAANVPFEVDNLVEILDAEGNPTGQYKARDGEAAREGTTFVTAEDGDHEVTIH